MTLTITPSVVPTGGAVLLDFTFDSNMTPESPMTLSRCEVVGGVQSPFTVLYTGDAIPLFIDVGDVTPMPLAAGTTIQYQVTDPTGTVTSPVLTPVGAILVEPDGLTSLLVRLLQAGITNLTLPPGIRAALPVGKLGPTVSNAMPMTGFPVLPYIVVNLDLIQQENIPIGQNVMNPDDNNVWTITSYAKRIWKISVLTRTAAERDFYRDCLIAIFQSLLGSVFVALGSNMNHRYQAASGQTADEYTGKSPGFYFSDVMMEVLGVFNTSIQSSYGLIEILNTTSTFPDGVEQQTTSPPP